MRLIMLARGAVMYSPAWRSVVISPPVGSAIGASKPRDQLKANR
jgi:hypothetical protein